MFGILVDNEDFDLTGQITLKIQMFSYLSSIQPIQNVSKKLTRSLFIPLSLIIYFKKEFDDLLNEDRLTKVPCLVYANKQDLETAESW